MKTFVIQSIHGDSQIARPVKWNSMKKKSTLRLSPDDDTVDCFVNELIIFHTFSYTPKYIATHHPLDTVGCM